MRKWRLIEFQFRKMKMFWKWMVVMVNSVNILHAPEQYT